MGTANHWTSQGHGSLMNFALNYATQKYGLLNGSIVDLGCGYAHNLAAQRDRFHNRLCIGVDTDGPTLVEAQKLYPSLNFRQSNVMATGLGSNSVALVMSANIADHMGPNWSSIDVDDFAAEVQRLLVPKGVYFAIDTTNNIQTLLLPAFDRLNFRSDNLGLNTITKLFIKP